MKQRKKAGLLSAALLFCSIIGGAFYYKSYAASQSVCEAFCEFENASGCRITWDTGSYTCWYAKPKEAQVD